MPWLSFLFGVIVGLSLGLTGGGGAIFAVPMLVYGLGSTTREAVGISLASVGVTSGVGFLGRWKSGQVEIRTGLLFAVAGMIGAPIGSWLAGLIPEPLLLTLFAILMLVVAYRMWSKAVASTPAATAACPVENPHEDGPSCQRDAAGHLQLTSRCARLLLLVGLSTGVLSGLFGVGGGFVIVPALIMFSGMAIHRAVGTSLLVITLVSISGVASHLYAGRTIPLEVTSWFVVGGVVGMLLGTQIGRHLSGPTLQKSFALAILAVAAFVLYRILFLK
ncbi:MAG: sulfite exporter TauE/SafE family protein [Planctomycetota bacterium]|nr:MAG: sulfite exporter TauE/SafE family protein [Planctomycetota bacterium]